MGDWVTLRHEQTGGTTRVHNHPDVLAAQAARGWSVVVEDDEPERTVYVPAGAEGEPAPEWVELVHPDLPTGTNRVPNNAAAIEAAHEAGWRYPDPPAEAVDEALREVHPRGGRATRAEREAAEQRAAAAAAATDEPPEVASGEQDQTAGDGAHQEEKP